jgi:DNA-binding MarR family transcriptional regulator
MRKQQLRAPDPRPKITRGEVVFLELSRTHDMLSRPFAALMKEVDLSPAQYNVLRILRGAPKGLPCGEIGSRMITRDPDITRLLDRLEKRELISRCRETKDRRMVITTITADGLKMLQQLDSPILETHHKQLSHMGKQKLRVLTKLLREAREASA